MAYRRLRDVRLLIETATTLALLVGFWTLFPAGIVSALVGVGDPSVFFVLWFINLFLMGVVGLFADTLTAVE